MKIEIPYIYFEEQDISDEEWANTPLSVQRAFKKLWEEGERLRAQNNQSSRNSSIPPSKDRLQHKKPNRNKASGLKRGGQPGHIGVTRPLVPVEQLSAPPLVLLPQDCLCGHHFDKDATVTGLPYRQQYIEVPPIKAVITEVQQQHCCCPDCGMVVRATLPAGMSTLTLGPNAQALVTYLTGQFHLSKRSVATLMRCVFKVPISAASIIAVEQEVSAALAAPVAQAMATAQESTIKYVDESGWPQQRDSDPGMPQSTPLKKGWLWSMTIQGATIYIIRRSRAQIVARELLGIKIGDDVEYDTVVVSDRHGAYNWLPLWARQLCWAHLDRDFLAISERADPIAQRIGKELLSNVDKLWVIWHEYRDGVLTFTQLGTKLTPVRAQIDALLREGQSADKKTSATCKKLRKVEPALWTFLRVEGVEPTNNNAERSQRRGVCKRDRTFGTQTSKGSRYVERILTTVATCHQQDKSALVYLTEAIIAHLHGLPAPVLIST